MEDEGKEGERRSEEESGSDRGNRRRGVDVVVCGRRFMIGTRRKR